MGASNHRTRLQVALVRPKTGTRRRGMLSGSIGPPDWAAPVRIALVQVGGERSKVEEPNPR